MAGKADNEDEAKAAYEALCRRCGICCHEKIRFGELVVITDVPCQFLDVETNLCTVYEDRFSRQPLCATAAHSAETATLPDDCPYVGGIANYPSPHLLSEHPEYERAVNALFPGRKKPGQK